MKKQLLSLLIALVTTVTGLNVNAQGTCSVPCAGPWTYDQIVFTESINGCDYRFTVSYEYRPCMGVMQMRFVGCGCLGFVIEDLDGCGLHCVDVPNLYRIVYNRVITALGSPILHASPSPCYYLGKIIVPPGAESCYGMTPGTERYVTVPCNTNGCCYSKLEAIPNGVYQTVMSSTPCPPPPATTPSNWTITWQCDILGGGFNTFNVQFIPDSPLTCQNVCSTGPYIFGSNPPAAKNGTTSIETMEHNALSDIKIYPNPVLDNCTIELTSANSAQELNIELIDISGKVLQSIDLMTKKGRQSINLDTRTLSPGVYTIKLVHGENVTVHKITK